MKTKPIRMVLRTPMEELPSGASRFWGNPDLPEDIEYPTYIDADGDSYPYYFVCQINLKELADFAPKNPLPHQGLLLFFAKIDSYLCDMESGEDIGSTISSADDVNVLYFPTTDNLREVVLVDDDDLPLAPEEMEIEFTYESEAYSDEHELFAEPVHRQWETWEAPFEDWTILLQIDSFEGEDFILNFMDCGVLDFLISPQALKNHDFSDVRAIVLSS